MGELVYLGGGGELGFVYEDTGDFAVIFFDFLIEVGGGGEGEIGFAL